MDATLKCLMKFNCNNWVFFSCTYYLSHLHKWKILKSWTHDVITLSTSNEFPNYHKIKLCVGWKKNRPHSQFNKKTNTKGKLKFYSCFKNDMCFHPMVSCWLLQVFNFVGNVLESIETSKYLCEVTWKRVTLRMLPMVTLSKEMAQYQAPKWYV